MPLYPYDKPEWVEQFLNDHAPRFGILMETEIWPNLMHMCAKQQIPLFLANARLSEKSQRGYLKIRGLVEPAMRTLSGCFAQTAEDAERLHLIGASNVHVCGNTKYDVSLPEWMKALAAAFKERIGNRPVVVCASTRFYKGQDEAEMLLEAWKRYKGDALLVIIPRHPERFQTTFSLAEDMGYRVQYRSDNLPIDKETQIWIGDSMGELFAYYLAADIAFVGGSLVDAGCQNVIEPISCGIPTLSAVQPTISPLYAKMPSMQGRQSRLVLLKDGMKKPHYGLPIHRKKNVSPKKPLSLSASTKEQANAWRIKSPKQSSANKSSIPLITKKVV